MLGCAILWFIINHNAYFRLLPVSGIHISQGSVATYLRCGGIIKYDFVANLPVSLPVKEFWKSVNIWGSYGQEFSVLFFFETVYYDYGQWAIYTEASFVMNIISKCYWQIWTELLILHYTRVMASFSGQYG